MRIEEWLGDRCKLVAEIGANHQGVPEVAHRLVTMAARAGVDCCKGQMRDLAAHPEWKAQPYVGPQSFGATYYEHRAALELPLDVHLNLRHAASAAGCDYGVSVWDARSARRVVESGGWTWVKIPSAALTDHELSRALCDSDLLVILSTGMSTEREVDDATGILDAGAAGRYMLLLCTSAYPCANEDVHLSRLETLAEYGVPVGVSGHWPGIQIDAAAVEAGARLIERHVTLDRTMRGTDHAASLGPRGVETWVRDVRAVEAARGTPGLRVLPCEVAARAKLRGA